MIIIIIIHTYVSITQIDIHLLDIIEGYDYTGTYPFCKQGELKSASAIKGQISE